LKTKQDENFWFEVSIIKILFILKVTGLFFNVKTGHVTVFLVFNWYTKSRIYL